MLIHEIYELFRQNKKRPGMAHFKKTGLKFCQTQHKPSKVCPSGEIFPNLVTLVERQFL